MMAEIEADRPRSERAEAERRVQQAAIRGQAAAKKEVDNRERAEHIAYLKQFYPNQLAHFYPNYIDESQQESIPKQKQCTENGCVLSGGKRIKTKKQKTKNKIRRKTKNKIRRKTQKKIKL
jgi:hypothetical protein